MGFALGDNEILYIQINYVYLPIACLTSNGMSEEAEMMSTTTKDDGGWETSIPVRQRFSIDFSGLVTNEISSTTEITYKDLRNIKRQRTLVDWKVTRTDGYADYGQGYITSLSSVASVDAFVQFDGSMVGYGNPANEFYNFYNSVIDRVTSDGGTIENPQCFKEDIKKQYV